MDLKEVIREHKFLVLIIFIIGFALLFQSGGLHNLFQVSAGGPYQPGDTALGEFWGTINEVNSGDEYIAICDGDAVKVCAEVKDPNGNIIGTNCDETYECMSVPWGLFWSVKLPNNAIAGTYNVKAYYSATTYFPISTKYDFGSTTFKVILSCDIGSKCGEVYVEQVCKNGDVYSKTELWRFNSNCECVFASYWYDLDERCDYGCSNGVCNPTQDKRDNGESCSSNSDCKSNNCLSREDVCAPLGYECWTNEGCSSGETCESGNCESGITCVDECDYFGEVECRNDINYFECGDYDEDDCKEWSEGGIVVGKCGVECKQGTSCPTGYKCVGFKCEETIIPETCEDNNYLSNAPTCPTGQTPQTIAVGSLTCYTGKCLSGEVTCESHSYYTKSPSCKEGEIAETIAVGSLTCYTGECKEGEDWTMFLIVFGGIFFLIIILIALYIAKSGSGRRRYYQSPYY